MTKNRSVEIDLLRVIAIILMMAYHTAFDLNAFYSWKIDVFHGVWWLVGKSSAVLFLLLVGISFSISWSRNPVTSRTLRRGVRVLAYGLIVTLVTYFFDSGSYVRFGILHLIGISLVLLPYTRRLHHWNTVIALIIIGIGLLIQDTTVGTALLLPIGFKPSGFLSIDYYPILPWFGVILMGASAGRYTQSLTLISESTRKRFPKLLRSIEWISRHSLAIYMIHQPLILGIMRFWYGH